ncbi:DNA mismatch repair protein MutT [Spongiactinospora rosea]|uniref:DNA mismatch repair protein MutT n=1 Tax=Spongiactinospora rosea TaxID=2248750 RepID=A0A366LY25_9ACTN|nr:NUDIX domain-containing protein [Spongiactinospora rosea]RBQ18677.1 DNA mismatch repair protein MutT [Spongiactinospora rosea]
MARTEYYDDPDAPPPNSLVVGVSVAIRDDQGRVLLQRRADNGLWAMPGGGMDLTESVPEAGRREVKEETGYDVEITGMTGLYTDARHIMAYCDGEVRRQFNICLAGRIVGGEMAISDESTELRWVPAAELDALPMHRTQRMRLRHLMENRDQPYIG